MSGFKKDKRKLMLELKVGVQTKKPNMCMNVHSSTVHGSQNVEITQMSITGQMEK